jgi:hypothetical protein
MRSAKTYRAPIFDEMRRGVQEIEFLADPTVEELRVGSTTADDEAKPRR